MNNSNDMNKGEHEKSMEKVKKMLDKGCGMAEMQAKTHLTPEDIIKAKNKLVDQS